jgi:hypothetical protein
MKTFVRVSVVAAIAVAGVLALPRHAFAQG